MTDAGPQAHPAEEPHIDRLTEKELELHALGVLGEIGWQHVPGADLGPVYGIRKGWGDLVLYPNLRKAIRRRYPLLPESVADDAISLLLDQQTLHDLRENHRFYERLTGGVSVPYDDPATGDARHAVIRPVDFGDPHANELIAASQVRIKSVKDRTFIFDIVLYVNGLPLAVVELKKADSNDSARTAYDQLQGYRRELKRTGTFATFLVMLASDGITARMGTPFTPWQHMAPWHADDHDRMLRKQQREDGRALERMLYGAFSNPSPGPDRQLPLVLRREVRRRQHRQARQGASVHRRERSRPGHRVSPRDRRSGGCRLAYAGCREERGNALLRREGRLDS